MFIHFSCPQAVDKWKLEKADPAISPTGTGVGETLCLAVNGIPFTRGSKARLSKCGTTAVQDIDATVGNIGLGNSNKFMRIHASQGFDTLGIGWHGAVFQPGAASGSLMAQAQEVDIHWRLPGCH